MYTKSNTSAGSVKTIGKNSSVLFFLPLGYWKAVQMSRMFLNQLF